MHWAVSQAEAGAAAMLRARPYALHWRRWTQERRAHPNHNIDGHIQLPQDLYALAPSNDLQVAGQQRRAHAAAAVAEASKAALGQLPPHAAVPRVAVAGLDRAGVHLPKRAEHCHSSCAFPAQKPQGIDCCNGIPAGSTVSTACPRAQQLGGAAGMSCMQPVQDMGRLSNLPHSCIGAADAAHVRLDRVPSQPALQKVAAASSVATGSACLLQRLADLKVAADAALSGSTPGRTVQYSWPSRTNSPCC